MKDAFKTLPLDARDAVEELMDHPGWKPFLHLVHGLVRQHEEKLLTMNVGGGADQVVYQKCRVEGAQQLSTDITKLPVLIRALNKG